MSMLLTGKVGPASEGVQAAEVLPGVGTAPAYELKFLLDEDKARAVEAWARSSLVPDPHGDPALAGAYRTTSLYFDTAQLDVLRRSPGYRRRKFRVRRYGLEPWLFLERKSRWGDRVKKRRTRIAHDDLQLLAQAASPAAWPGYWFYYRLSLHRLSPVCRIVYDRKAWIGRTDSGSSSDGRHVVRLTLDRSVCGVLAEQWSLTAPPDGRPLLPGKVILELKFRSSLPVPFKELVADLKLSPSSVSKYRLCHQ